MERESGTKNKTKRKVEEMKSGLVDMGKGLEPHRVTRATTPLLLILFSESSPGTIYCTSTDSLNERST